MKILDHRNNIYQCRQYIRSARGLDGYQETIVIDDDTLENLMKVLSAWAVIYEPLMLPTTSILNSKSFQKKKKIM